MLTFEDDTEIKDDRDCQSESPDVTEAAMIDCVKNHVPNVLNGDTRCIVVSRLRMWETSNAFFKRKSFKAKTGLLKVTFANSLEEEDAIDQGGPRREFFHLLLKDIVKESGTLTSMYCIT